MAHAPSFRSLLGLEDPPPSRSFRYSPADGELVVTGYSVEEVERMLVAYREHQSLLMTIASGTDAVRYTPTQEAP